MDNYKDFMATQDSIRLEMLVILRKHPRPLARLAEDIDISPISLKKFLVDEKDVDFTRFCKIDSWASSFNEKTPE